MNGAAPLKRSSATTLDTPRVITVGVGKVGLAGNCNTVATRGTRDSPPRRTMQPIPEGRRARQQLFEFLDQMENKK